MTKLECLLVAVLILAGLVIGLIIWTNGTGSIDLSAWARWLMQDGNDLLDIVAYYLGG